jgi:DNA polymerase/3'-5' exonuclease PolX
MFAETLLDRKFESLEAQDSVSNQAIAAALHELAAREEAAGNGQEAIDLELASMGVLDCEEPLQLSYLRAGYAAVSAVAGVGRAAATQIAELLEHGKLSRLEALRRRCPSDLPALSSLPGIDPRRALALYDSRGVRSVEELAGVLERGRARGVLGLDEAAPLEDFELVLAIGQTQ